MASLLAFALAARVVVIGVDGLSVHAIPQADAPNINRIIKMGAWTLTARGVMPTVSSPNWASMIMAAGPEQHGVTSNEWQREKHEIEPVCQGTDSLFPTVFGVLRQQKPAAKIAVFHHWDGFARLVEKGAPDKIAHFKTGKETAESALAYWKQNKPDLLFVHLDLVDDAGHGHGWLTPEYYSAVTEADTYIGEFLKAIGPDTLLIVSADHGGTGKSHGNLNMGELQIPWMAIGAGVKAGQIKTPVNTYDTAATAAHALNLKPHPCWIGKPVL